MRLVCDQGLDYAGVSSCENQKLYRVCAYTTITTRALYRAMMNPGFDGVVCASAHSLSAYNNGLLTCLDKIDSAEWTWTS